MKIISNGESYGEKKFKELSLYKRKLAIDALWVLAAVFAGGILSKYWHSLWPMSLTLLAAFFLFRKWSDLYDKTEDSAGNFKIGIDGENEVVMFKLGV